MIFDVYLIDPNPTQIELIQDGRCPYCSELVDFDWRRSKHMPNDMVATCPDCGHSYMECYDVSGYLLMEVSDDDVPTSEDDDERNEGHPGHPYEYGSST